MISVVRLGMIVAVAAVVTWFAAAFRIERRLGGTGEPWVAFDVDVPDEATYDGGAAAIERTWRQRLGKYRVKTSLARDGRPGAIRVHVEVIGARPDDAPTLRKSLTGGARLEFRVVANDQPVTAAWYAAVTRDRLDIGDATMDVESWSNYATRTELHDAFLRGPTEASLDHAIEILQREHPLPADLAVMYEQIVPQRDAEANVPYYRSYLVHADVLLANEHVASATVSYDPNSLLPEVALEFTRDGGRRFGDATGAMVGQKLAIILDGRIKSAPTVLSAIRGGRASITMGAASPAEMERDAQDLVAVLGSPTRLPDGIEARLVGHAAGSPEAVWLTRAFAGVLAGAFAWVLAWFANRRRWFAAAPAVRPEPAVPNWFEAMVPVTLTFGIPLALWFAARELTLPGVNSIEIANVLSRGSGDGGEMFGVFALGVMPVVSAFILVELVAAGLELLLPDRRGRRLGTPADRRRLDRAGWGLVLALAALQAFFIAQYLDVFSSRGAEVLASGGRSTQLLIIVTLTAGVMVQVVAAEIITRFGLCNGYLALLGAGAFDALYHFATLPGTPGLAASDLRFIQATFALAALAAVAATRLRSVTATGEPGPRLPYTGAVPATIVRGGIGLLATAALWSQWLAEHLYDLADRVLLLELGALVPLTALILWTARRPWSTPGIVATVGFLAVLVLVPFGVAAPLRLVLPIADGVLFGVVLSEAFTGLRARLGITRPTTVLVVHDVARADEVADRLAAAGIPHAVLGARARAMLRLLGAFVPVEIRVPAEHAESARAVL